MIDLELPLDLSSEAPAFVSEEAASEWLVHLPLANSPHAQAVLTRQLELLAGTALSLDQRLRIIEVLRDAVLFVQQECLRHFSARPLPLNAAERTACEASLALWRMLETNYLLCLQNSLAGQLPDQAAVAAQRAVAAKTGELFAQIAAGRLPSAAYWFRLHQIYRAAETLQVTLRTVADEFSTRPGTTLAAAYVEPLLLAAASPHELTPRQVAMVARWARRWAETVSILAEPPRTTRTPPITIDLSNGAAISATDNPNGADLRWLDVTDLRKSLKRRLQALANGESPESLQLGSDCVQPDCEELLRRVYRLWCKGEASSIREPGPATDCELASGFPAIYFFVTGEVFSQPDASGRLGKREHEEIATFGGVLIRRREEDKQRCVDERWQARSEAIAELRLSRSLEQGGARIGRGQLLAIHPSGTSGFMLAVVRSAAISPDENQLRLGVHLLPGVPSALALRPTGLAVGNDPFCPGFRLPALLQEPASILMPSGYFRAGRIIETYTDLSRQVRLTKLLERGADFERAAFEWE